MKQIFKYNLPEVVNHIKLPVGSVIISAINQHNTVVLYAMVNKEEEFLVNRKILVLNTGVFVDGMCSFIATVSLDMGNTIVHVFEEKN